jgi:DNA-3-methyladenine glycosylase
MARIVKAKSVQTKQTVELARSLLGKLLVRRLLDGSFTRHRITEVEAYDGETDLACHASKGRTKRTQVMFGPGGVWYVYLCYGVHEMLNLVTGPEHYPAAILIRGVEGIVGPGRVTRALRIDRTLNGEPMAERSGLWIEDDGFVVPRNSVQQGPRIGVDYAGPIWASKPWRFHFTPEINSMERRAMRAGKRRAVTPPAGDIR